MPPPVDGSGSLLFVVPPQINMPSPVQTAECRLRGAGAFLAGRIEDFKLKDSTGCLPTIWQADVSANNSEAAMVACSLIAGSPTL